MCLPIGHVLGNIALVVLDVEDLAQLAAVLTWGDTVQANVKLLAVGRVRVARMSLRVPVAVQLLLFRALETIVQFCVLWHNKVTLPVYLLPHLAATYPLAKQFNFLPIFFK